MKERRQPILGISGWMIAVCLFLPTLRVCGDATAPIEFPPTYVIYVGGIAIAIGAMARTTAGKKAAFTALVWLWLLTAAVIGVVWIGAGVSPLVGVFAGMLALAGVVVLGRRMWEARLGARAFAAACVAHAVLATGWNVLLAFDPDAMWGARVALAVSCAILVGSLLTLREAQREARNRDHSQLPQARVIP